MEYLMSCQQTKMSYLSVILAFPNVNFWDKNNWSHRSRSSVNSKLTLPGYKLSLYKDDESSKVTLMKIKCNHRSCPSVQVVRMSLFLSQALVLAMSKQPTFLLGPFIRFSYCYLFFVMCISVCKSCANAPTIFSISTLTFMAKKGTEM